MKATGDLEIQFAVSGPWAIGQPRVTRPLGAITGLPEPWHSFDCMSIFCLNFRKAALSAFKGLKERIR